MLSNSRYTAVRFASFLLLGLLLGAAQVGASAGEVASMPPGAFLRTPVSDMNDLNRELRTDKLVVSRYSRLMRLTPDMVRATFAQLHLTHLQKDMVLEVHYVHAGETIGAKARRVRKGTAVFAMADGTPVLARICGNPLRAIGAPAKQLMMRPDAEPNVAKGPNMADMDVTPDFDPAEPLNAATPAAASNSITMRDAAPTVEVLPESKDTLAADEMPADVMEPGEILPTQTIAQANNSLATWVSGAAAVVVAGLLGTSNIVDVASSAVSPVRAPVLPLPTKGGQGAPTGVAATPEPTSIMFVMALATTMLTSAGLRRRKSR